MLIAPRQESKYQKGIYDFSSGGDGHAAINAVAGSGKTTTIVQCALDLPYGIQADSCFVAFNKHISDEMTHRLPSHMECNTIHSLGYRALQRALAPMNPHQWLDGYKYRKMAREWCKNNNIPLRDAQQEITNAIRFAMLTLTRTGDTPAFRSMCYLYDCVPTVLTIDELEGAVWTLMHKGEYEANRWINFDEMVYLPVKLGIRTPKFSRLFVDEAQDMNRAQQQFVKSLLRPEGRAIFVGDPRQAIYRFAGADSDAYGNIVGMMDATELPLSVCYRCPTSHVQLAKAIVPQIEAWENSAPGIIGNADYREVASGQAIGEGDMVLCRCTAPLVSLCLELIQMGMPARVLGRDIGENLNRLIDSVSAMEGFNYDDFGQFLDRYHWINLQMLMRGDEDENEMAIQSLDDRVSTVETIYIRASQQSVRSLERLKEFTSALFDDNERGVTLCTIHKAKGLECDTVYFLEPQLCPHPKAKSFADKQQEMNLRYVALTRAKKALYFVTTKGE